MSESGASFTSDTLSISSGIIGVRAEDRNSITEKVRAKSYEFFGNVCDRKRRKLSLAVAIVELFTFFSLCLNELVLLILFNVTSSLLGYWGSFENYADKIFVLKIAVFLEGFYHVLLGLLIGIMFLMFLSGIISYAAIAVGY